MTTRRSFKTFGLVAVLGLATLSGCSALTGDSDSGDDDFRVSRDRDRDRYDENGDVVLSGDRYDDRYRDRDTGRSADVDSSTANKVPRDARVVDSGSDRLTFTAPYDGSVYLYDEDARRVIWDERLRDGDRVSISPDDNRIDVNGRSQADLDLKSEHRFRLYYLEGLKSTRDRNRF
jgi:hypothetical protein